LVQGSPSKRSLKEEEDAAKKAADAEAKAKARMNLGCSVFVG